MKKEQTPSSKSDVLSKVLYAVVTTVLVVCCTNSNQDDKASLFVQQSPTYLYNNGQKVSYSIVSDKIPIKLTRIPGPAEIRAAEEFEIDTSFHFLNNVVVVKKPSLGDTSKFNSVTRNFAPPISKSMEAYKGIIRINNAPFIVLNKIAVGLQSAEGQQAIESIARERGCTIESRISSDAPRFSILCPNYSLGEIIKLSNDIYETGLVIYSHPDLIPEVNIRSPVYPNDPLFKDQWHLNNTGQCGGINNADVNAPEAWEITKGDESIIIAIIDDAFDATHEDLFENVVGTKDFTDEPDDDHVFPNDVRRERHGTHVAGVAAAKGGNLKGVSGSCPDCRLLLIRALGGSVQDHADAMYYAAANGASIISNSWGYNINAPVTDVVTTAIREVSERGRGGLGCIILFAMTNENVNNCAQSQPDISSHPNVIAVSASSDQDKICNAGYGDCMDVVAPTKNSNRPGITTIDISGTSGSSRDNYFNNFSGTSSATPLTAGVVGLMLSVNPKLSREQVYIALTSTCDKIDLQTANYNTQGFSRKYGYGRVNAFRAVKEAQQTLSSTNNNSNQ